ncbi:hypothetical protein ARMSODRAFT_1025452, partial [Armillaria solidipes]
GALGTGSEEDLHDGLRVEWLKSRARSQRWGEEVLLVKEEMRRTLEGLEHDARQWEAHCMGYEGAGVTTEHREGMQAYAYRQAAVYRSLAASFSALWGTTASETLRPTTCAEEAQEIEAHAEETQVAAMIIV